MSARPSLNPKYAVAAALAGVIALIGAGWLYISSHSVAVFSPKGWVAGRESRLIITATILMATIIIPVFILTAVIAWKYRENAKHPNYQPDWDHNTILEFAWWALPLLIIVILSVMAYNSSHQLDPFRPLAAAGKPIKIQVVALQWRWLFIYPEQHIASINLVKFPAGQPVDFEITSDAPMNSFWIPNLGGQIYAMSGMSTQLHLIADHPGVYDGSSANLSGDGFAGMAFKAEATTPEGFSNWLAEAQASNYSLNSPDYDSLSKPSKDSGQHLFAYADPALFGNIVEKYLTPGRSSQWTY